MKPRKTEHLSPQELFAHVVDGAVSGDISLEDATDLIGNAVASMTAKRLDEIGLRREFEACVFAIKHVVVGMAAAKLVEMKRAAKFRAAGHENPL
jgi:hypothetical protein